MEDNDETLTWVIKDVSEGSNYTTRVTDLDDVESGSASAAPFSIVDEGGLDLAHSEA